MTPAKSRGVRPCFSNDPSESSNIWRNPDRTVGRNEFSVRFRQTSPRRARTVRVETLHTGAHAVPLAALGGRFGLWCDVVGQLDVALALLRALLGWLGLDGCSGRTDDVLEGVGRHGGE